MVVTSCTVEMLAPIAYPESEKRQIAFIFLNLH